MSVSLFKPEESSLIRYNLMFALPTERMGQTQFNATQKRLQGTFHVSPPREQAYDVVINEQARMKVKRLTQPMESAQTSFVILRTVKNGLKAAHKIVIEMKDLAKQARDTATADGDRITLDQQLKELPLNLNKSVVNTTYNGVSLLDGTFDAAFSFATSPSYQVKVKIGDTRAAALQLNTLNLTTQTDADLSYQKIDKAIQTIKTNVAAIHTAESKIAKILFMKNTTMFDDMIERDSFLRTPSAAADMLKQMKVQILSPNEGLINPEVLYKTNNHTVLQLLANALDLPFRP